MKIFEVELELEIGKLAPLVFLIYNILYGLKFLNLFVILGPLLFRLSLVHPAYKI